MEGTTIKAYLKRAEEARARVLDKTEDIVMKNEKLITQLNIAQITNHQSSNGGTLLNNFVSTNKKSKGATVFSGRYSGATQAYADAGIPYPSLTAKLAGDPYNFVWSGDFVGNFELEMSSDKTSFRIFSTGTGSGKKRAFFQGYGDNLYGLTEQNTRKVNYEIVLPELMIFLNKHL